MNKAKARGATVRTATVAAPRILALAAAFLAVGTLGLTGALAGGSTPADGATPTAIDSCTTVTEPGEYVLTDDVRDDDAETCIEVRADDVLLDGANHTIDGVSVGQASSGVGVEPGAENVTVRNLRVFRWAFGVRFAGVSGGEIRNVETRLNADGVRVEASREVRVGSVVAEHNFVGVAVARSANVAVTDTAARWNGIYGVSVAGGADVALGNVTTARNEMGLGIFAVADATVRNATVVSNRMTGLELWSVADARVSNLTVRANADDAYVWTPQGVVAVDAADVELSETRDSRVENVTTGRNWSVALGSDSVNDSVAVRTDAGNLSFSGSGVVVSSVASPPEPLADRESLGPAVSTETTTDDATLTLTAAYSATALAAANVAEPTLRFWRYDGSWSPVEETETEADRNLARATVEDATVLALLAEYADDAGGETRRPESGNETGPVSVSEKLGVRIEFACDDVRVSVPEGVSYSLVVHYYDAKLDTYDQRLLGPLSGTTEEPFDSEIVFFEVNVVVNGRVVVSGFIPDECPNAPRL